ncbi:MAG: FAD binding domain-containing protein [Acidobacteriaceae bacterium]
MSLSEFKYLRPRAMAQAVEALAKHATDPDAKANEARLQIVAGGTDMVPSMKQRLFTPEVVLDISGIAELRGIRQTDAGVEIGALTSLSTVEQSAEVKRDYRVLHEAAATVASPILRNMGTIGGNICLDTRCVWYNQSLSWRKSCGFCIKKDGDLCHVAPGGKTCWAVCSADTPAALLCLDAEIEIAGPGGARRMALQDFYVNIGDARNKLKRNEMVTRVFLPKAAAGMRASYQKLRLRGTIDYPLAGVAVALRCDADGTITDARVAITGVNPAPQLVSGAAEALVGKHADEASAMVVGEMAAKVAKPLTTSLLTPEYRREMVRVFAKRGVVAAG